MTSNSRIRVLSSLCAIVSMREAKHDHIQQAPRSAYECEKLWIRCLLFSMKKCKPEDRSSLINGERQVVKNNIDYVVNYADNDEWYNAALIRAGYESRLLDELESRR